MKNKKRTLIAALFMLCLMMAVSLQAMAASASIKLNKTKLSIELDEKYQLVATVTGKSQTVKWTSSNKKIVKVDSNGNLTPVKAGKATIKAKANGKTISCTVTVKNIDYRKLYKKFLEKSTFTLDGYTYNAEDCYYYILNIDKKGVPELVICPMNVPTQIYISYYVYTIKNNKVKYSGSCGYAYQKKAVLYYSSKQKAIGSNTVYLGYGANGLYTLSNYKLKSKRYCEANYRASTYKTGTSSKSLKTVTKKKYDKYYNTYFKNLKTYTMKANTASNRESILNM